MFTIWYIIYLLIVSAGFIMGIRVHSGSKQLRSIIFLLGVTLLSETLSRFFAKYMVNSSPIYHVFDPIQILCWGIFFHTNSGWRNTRRGALIVSVLLALFSVINSIFIQHITEFPDNFLKAESLTLLFFSILLFIEKLDAPVDVNLFRDPIFLVSLALIWFNLTNFAFFQFWDFLVRKNLPLQSIRFNSYFSNYVFYLIIAISMTQKTIHYGRENNR